MFGSGGTDHHRSRSRIRIRDVLDPPRIAQKNLSDLKIAGQVIDLKSIPDVVQWTEINGVAMTAIDSYTAPDQVKTPSTQ